MVITKEKHHYLDVVCTYDCLTGISNILSLLIYGGVWQRPDPHTDEHQPKNRFYGMAEVRTD